MRSGNGKRHSPIFLLRSWLDGLRRGGRSRPPAKEKEEDLRPPLFQFSSSWRFSSATRTASITKAEKEQSLPTICFSTSSIKLFGNRIVLLVVGGMAGILNFLIISPHTTIVNIMCIAICKTIVLLFPKKCDRIAKKGKKVKKWKILHSVYALPESVGDLAKNKWRIG